MIPRIIHQTGPSDKQKWNKLWYHSHAEWKRLYPRFECRLWCDDDISEMMREHYPQYAERYENLHLHILQIDVSRLFLLHQYGGIYSDLDYVPYGNFYRMFGDNFNVVGALSKEERVQNCLMASPPGNPQILELIDYMFAIYDSKDKFVDDDRFNDEFNVYVHGTFGPKALSEYIDNMDHTVLPKENFNPPPAQVDGTYYGKHFLTGVWGETTFESWDTLEEFKDYHVYWFTRHRARGFSEEMFGY